MNVIDVKHRSVHRELIDVDAETSVTCEDLDSIKRRGELEGHLPAADVREGTPVSHWWWPGRSPAASLE
ncbi:MAG: hypothetical protein H0W42_10965 [Gemmatimonadaceae bacterium]|nr:hypothetical protein [Gemmatimonadaceae bacterium]